MNCSDPPWQRRQSQVMSTEHPDAVIQISALAIKSGIRAILKGGREAVRSCQGIVTAIQAGLQQAV